MIYFKNKRDMSLNIFNFIILIIVSSFLIYISNIGADVVIKKQLPYSSAMILIAALFFGGNTLIISLTKKN